LTGPPLGLIVRHLVERPDFDPILVVIQDTPIMIRSVDFIGDYPPGAQVDCSCVPFLVAQVNETNRLIFRESFAYHFPDHCGYSFLAFRLTVNRSFHENIVTRNLNEIKLTLHSVLDYG
jgi:hypothetical protein